MKPAKISLIESLLPIILLIILLGINVLYFGDEALSGSNQFVLILSAAFTVTIGLRRGVKFNVISKKIDNNIRSTAPAIIILLMVGALAGSWLISGIIPTMIYYGINLINPSIFLVASIILASISSIVTGSSWTTSATMGVALIGIGNTLGIPQEITAGAVISGAYFGDKLSPFSETTNLAPAIAGVNLYTHIRYMTITTIPSYIITIIVFVVISLNLELKSSIYGIENISNAISDVFFISPILFSVPLLVFILILKKVEPLIALFISTILGVILALIFQGEVLFQLIDKQSESIGREYYVAILKALTGNIQVETANPILNELFQSGGMGGMLNTIWLIICAMVFGGTMEAIGALKRITESLLNLFKNTLGLFASTIMGCITVNITASDQYLSIVLPGNMFSKAFKKKGLAPENLSRTLEDSGTVTSVLIPWNTCGAYQSTVLGVSTLSYLPYAVFNYISPFTTLAIVSLKYKIKKLAIKSKKNI